MSEQTNLNHLVKRLAQQSEEAPARAGDIFDKAFAFTRADEAMAAGIYPYFKAISEQHYFSFYAVVLSALLIHYYFDHFLFLQVDDVITPRWS